MELVRGVGETFYARSVNKAIGDATSVATLGPELIFSLRAMGDDLPQLQANRLTLLQARANIHELFKRAMRWSPEHPHFGRLRYHVVREAAMLTTEEGPHALAFDEFHDLLEHVPPDIGGLDRLERLEFLVRDALDPESGPPPRVTFAALNEALGLDKTDCQTTVHCTDYPLWNPQFINVVTSGIGPDAILNMTEPTNWPKLFSGYWTEVVSSPPLQNTDPNSPYTWKHTHEKLDFTTGQAPFQNISALKPYQRVEVCLMTGKAEEQRASGETSYKLEYRLADAASFCMNAVDSVYSYDTGYAHVTTSPSSCAVLVQQKGIGFTYPVTPLISLLNNVTCFAWRKALEGTTYYLPPGGPN